MWHKIRKTLLLFCFGVLYLTLILTFVIKVFKKDIEQFVVNQIKDYLNTSIYINEIEFSILEKFPNASFQLKNILIYDAYPNKIKKDTFFFAKKLYLEFDIYNIINQKYNIKNISCQNATLNIRKNKEGQGNYNLIKFENDSSKSSNFKLLLEKVELENLKFNYFDYKNDQNYSLYANDLKLKGNFASDRIILHSELDFRINKIRDKSIFLLKNKNALANFILNVNTNTNEFKVKNGQLQIENMLFEINGNLKRKKMQLNAKGKNITLDQLMNTLNKTISSNSYNYRSKGFLNFYLSLKNTSEINFNPSINGSFSIKNGAITEISKNITLKNINLRGNFKKSKGNEYIELEKFSLNILDAYLNGKLKINNFKQAIITSKINGVIDLNQLHNFFHFKGVEKVLGKVHLKSNLIIYFKNSKFAENKFVIKQNNSTLKLINLAIKPSLNNVFIRNVNGEIHFRNNETQINKLALKINNSDVKLNGKMQHFFQFIQRNSKLKIDANINSNHFQLDELMNSSVNLKKTQETNKILPENINLNLNISVNNLKIQDKNFNALKSNVTLFNSILKIKNINIEHLGGHLNGNIYLNNQQKESIFKSNLNLKNINIQKLFKEWNNFNQNTVTYQNIKGIAQIQSNINALFNENNKLIKDKLVSNTSFKIYNGELINLPVFQSIIQSIYSNKMIRLLFNKQLNSLQQKLTHLKFDTLSNQIFIQNENVFMPKMQIVSNFLDLNLSANHSFKNEIDYHFDFLFNHLKGKNSYNQFGKINNDNNGFRVFLRMYGTSQNPKFSWDKKAKRKTSKEKFIQEKEKIKSLFKNEFKKSKNNKFNKTQKNNEEFIFLDHKNSE